MSMTLVVASCIFGQFCMSSGHKTLGLDPLNVDRRCNEIYLEVPVEGFAKVRRAQTEQKFMGREFHAHESLIGLGVEGML